MTQSRVRKILGRLAKETAAQLNEMLTQPAKYPEFVEKILKDKSIVKALEAGFSAGLAGRPNNPGVYTKYIMYYDAAYTAGKANKNVGREIPKLGTPQFQSFAVDLMKQWLHGFK